MASPLLLPLAMGAVFAVLFFPLYLRLERWKFSGVLASGILTFAITVLILFPAAILIFLGARAGLDQLKLVKLSTKVPGETFAHSFLDSPGVHRVLEWITQMFPVTMQDLISVTQDLAGGIGLKIADILGRFVTQLPGLTMGLAIMVISIYFFLLDGKSIVRYIRENAVFKPQETERLIHSFASMCRSVILATVVSGFVQALVFGMSSFGVGLSGAPLIALLVFFSSFIPLIGSAPITLGVVVQQFMAGDRTAGLILLVAAVVTSTIDNFIRPAVLKGAGNLHPLLAFVAAFGGLQILGFAGVFLGPVVAALFVVTVDHLIRKTA